MVQWIFTRVILLFSLPGNRWLGLLSFCLIGNKRFIICLDPHIWLKSDALDCVIHEMTCLLCLFVEIESSPVRCLVSEVKNATCGGDFTVWLTSAEGASILYGL